MVRNFSTSMTAWFCPMRRCRKSTGPRLSSLTASAISASSGSSQHQQQRAQRLVLGRLDEASPIGERLRLHVDQADGAEVRDLVGGAVIDQIGRDMRDDMQADRQMLEARAICCVRWSAACGSAMMMRSIWPERARRSDRRGGRRLGPPVSSRLPSPRSSKRPANRIASAGLLRWSCDAAGDRRRCRRPRRGRRSAGLGHAGEDVRANSARS